MIKPWGYKCRNCGEKLLRWSWYEDPKEPVYYGYCLKCDINGKEPCIQILQKTG